MKLISLLICITLLSCSKEMDQLAVQVPDDPIDKTIYESVVLIVDSANLGVSEVDKIMTRAYQGLKQFKVTLTTDKNIFDTASPYKRIRVLLIDTISTNEAGYAYSDSFTDGNNFPAYVFASQLKYSNLIAIILLHEIGHSLGLHHNNLDGYIMSGTNPYNDYSDWTESEKEQIEKIIDLK